MRDARKIARHRHRAPRVTSTTPPRLSSLSGSPLPPSARGLQEGSVLAPCPVCTVFPGDRLTPSGDAKEDWDEARRNDSAIHGTAGAPGGTARHTHCGRRVAGQAMPAGVRRRDRRMRRGRRPPPGLQEADAQALQEKRSCSLLGCGSRREYNGTDCKSSSPPPRSRRPPRPGFQN